MARIEVEIANSRNPQFYVYFLIDPRDNSIFYVGKGTRNRIKDHVRESRSDNISAITNFDKVNRIQEIENSGHRVSEVVIERFLFESDAYEVESSFISLLANSGITNKLRPNSASRIESNRASWLLRRMKNFDEWVNTASAEAKRTAIKQFGSMRQCYDQICKETESLVIS